MHRPKDTYMSILLRSALFPPCFLLAGAFLFQSSALSQSASGAKVSVTLQPALAAVQQSVNAVYVTRWKAPNEVRSDAQQNLSSIQRDLAETLPGLLSQADAASGAVSPVFAVYRNIDALYDVLLRVEQTAILAAPDQEAQSLSDALAQLDSARKQLGGIIDQNAQDREAQIVKLQAAVKTVAVAPAPAASKPNVVDDGPAATPVRKRKKPAAKPAPQSAPANSTPTQTPSPQQ
jgi:hypothetical protein